MKQWGGQANKVLFVCILVVSCTDGDARGGDVSQEGSAESTSVADASPRSNPTTLASVYREVVGQCTPRDDVVPPLVVFQRQGPWVRMSRDDVLPVLVDGLAGTPHRWPEVRMSSGARVWRGDPGEYRGVQPGLASTILTLDERADVDSIIFGPNHLTAVTGDEDHVFFLGRCTGPFYTDYLMDFAAAHSSASQVRALKTIVKNPGILADDGASR